MAVNVFTKIYNLWRQPTRRTNLTTEKYIPYYDGMDNFPLVWHQAISESPSGTSCVSTIQDFLEGEGFDPTELENIVVNSKGETLFQIHQKVSKDFGEYEGFYFLLRYNRLGNVTEWEVLPFENCRLGKPDDKGYISKIHYNPFFGTADYKQNKDTTCYDVFNPKAVTAQIARDGDSFKGQVFFYGTTNALSRFYPMPEGHSAMKWLKVEAGVADYHEDNINNGFLQPFMLLMKGDPNAPVNNPDSESSERPQTQAELFDEIVSANFMGAKRVGNMFVHWVTSAEEAPTVLNFPSNNSGDQFITLDTQATKKITVAFKVPAILANINEGVSLGGDGNMIRVAVKLMQQRVKPMQRIMTDSYEKILKLMKPGYNDSVKITPYNPYPELEILDDKIWDEMTTDERRDWIEANTDIVLIDVPTQNPASPTVPRVSNAIPAGIPDKIRSSVKKALAHVDKMGLTCMSRGGRMVADSILNNENMGVRQMKRIYNYLKKRDTLKNSTFDGCEAMNYHAWGGKEMEVFLENKLKEVDQWLN